MKKIISLFFLSFVFIFSFLYLAPSSSNKAYATCAGPNGVTFQQGDEYCGADSYPGNGPTTSSGVVCAAPITSSFFTCSSAGTFTPNSCGSNACGYNSATDIGCYATCKAAPTAAPGICNDGDRRCIGTSGSTTTYQTCQGGAWGADQTCPTAGSFCTSLSASPFASCQFPAPTAPAPTSQPSGGNYTVSGKVFLDNAYSGSTNQTGMAGISVTLTYQSSGSTVTKADGTYTITLPYNSGQITEDVVVSYPKGYSISPATLDQQLNTGSKQILGSGNQIRIGISPSNPHPVVNFGLVTPPSSVKVDYGTFTINTGVSNFDLFGGVPQIMVDQTIQEGGGFNGLPMKHALTDKTGKVSFTGIKTSEWGYALTLTVPPDQVIHSAKVNGVDIGAGNPMLFVFQTVNMTGWNQSLMTPLGTGVVKFQNIIYVDPAKTSAPLSVQWYLSGSTGFPNGYWLIGYPNGGGYCMPVSLGGYPISLCAQMKNLPPGGVTGTDPNPNPSAGVSQVPSVSISPSGTPNNPVCDKLTETTPCHSAPANTCGTNNGTQTKIYDSSTNGQQCTQLLVPVSCTMNNCSAGNTCQNGSCGNPTQPSITPTVAVTESISPTSLPTATPTIPLSPTSQITVPICIQSTIPPSTGPAPLTVMLHGGGQQGGPDSAVAGYQWDFDNNGSWDTDVNINYVTHTYSQPGTYSPKYRIQGANGRYSVTCNYRYQVVATSPSNSPTLTPIPAAGDTLFNLILGLDGIGTTGDNANPGNSSGSNKNPLHKTRNVVVEVFNSSGNLILTKTGSVIYNPGNLSELNKFGGLFSGTVNMGSSLVSGSYTIKIKSDGYLRKQVPGIQVLTTTSSVNNVYIDRINLVTGDITQDNIINIIDYNIFVSCSVYNSDSGQLCNSNSSYRTLSDLDDNGTVDQFDYNLFIREYSVQNGQ